MSSTALLAGLGITLCTAPALAQAVPAEPPSRTELPRISATWTQAPIADVLLAFSTFSGKSIVGGEAVTGSVTAEIKDQPWDVALRVILSSQSLIAVEDEYGIIRVSNLETLDTREAVEPILTRVYRVSFSWASELQATIAPLLSPRGSVTAAESSNSLIVSEHRAGATRGRTAAWGLTRGSRPRVNTDKLRSRRTPGSMSRLDDE